MFVVFAQHKTHTLSLATLLNISLNCLINTSYRNVNCTVDRFHFRLFSAGIYTAALWKILDTIRLNNDGNIKF